MCIRDRYWNCREENIDSVVLCHRPCQRTYRLSDGGFAGHALSKGCRDSCLGGSAIDVYKRQLLGNMVATDCDYYTTFLGLRIDTDR